MIGSIVKQVINDRCLLEFWSWKSTVTQLRTTDGRWSSKWRHHKIYTIVQGMVKDICWKGQHMANSHGRQRQHHRSRHHRQLPKLKQDLLNVATYVGSGRNNTTIRSRHYRILTLYTFPYLSGLACIFDSEFISWREKRFSDKYLSNSREANESTNPDTVIQYNKAWIFT